MPRVRPDFRPAPVLGTTALLAVLLLAGCAWRADLDYTVDEVMALKEKQDQEYHELKSQLDRRAGQIEASQTDLSQSQSEFRNQADSISSELARLGSAVAALQRQVEDLSQRTKDLQNTQAIGLGTLSQRLDDTGAKLETLQNAQGQKLDQFATEVSGQVDASSKELTSLSKGVKTLTARDKQREKSVADLTKKLDALGKKLTAEVAAQQKQISQAPGGGADAGEVAALKKRVDFLGGKLPKEVDGQAKRLAKLEKDLRDMATLLSDLNGRLKGLEAR
jgi:DNA repair exonuclease SbcCD ATPase subunit